MNFKCNYFERFIYYTCKSELQREKGRDRREIFQSTGSLPEWSQWPELDKSKAGS